MLGVLGGTTDAEIYDVAISPDGKVIALGDAAGTVTTFDAQTRRRLAVYQLGEGPGGGLVLNVVFSPDSKTLAVMGQEPPDSPPLVDLLDARTLKRRLRIGLPPFPDPDEFVFAAAVFLPNGRDLVVQQHTFPGGPASVLHRVNGETGARVGRAVHVGRSSSFDLFATADRRHIFVTSANETYELDARTLRVVRRYRAGDFAGAVSPDKTLFALGSETGIVRLLDLRSGLVRQFRGRHEGGVLRLAFTPDGRTLLSSDDEGRVLVWDVGKGAISEELSGHSGGVWGLAVSPDGGTAYSSADDGQAILWDIGRDRRLVREFPVGRTFVGDESTPRGIAVSPDGRTLAYTHSDGTFDLVDARTLERRRSVRALRGFAGAVEFSPDGRLIAIAGARGRITLWDARTLEPAGELRGLEGDIQALAFSPDGELLAVAEREGLGRAAPPTHLERPPARAHRFPQPDVGQLAGVQPRWKTGRGDGVRGRRRGS